jgi:hypothetical protein
MAVLPIASCHLSVVLTASGPLHCHKLRLFSSAGAPDGRQFPEEEHYQGSEGQKFWRLGARSPARVELGLDGNQDK